jgi:excisionase family DNA binding protein
MTKTQPFQLIITEHMTVQAASTYSGYNIQYIRRLLRAGQLPGIKIGQLWLIEKSAFDKYISNAQFSEDRRFGSSSYKPTD